MGSACGGVDCAGDEVIACDDGVVLGWDGVEAAVAESVADEVAAGSLVTLRSVPADAVVLRLLRVEAVVLLVERDEWRAALELEAGAGSTSFTGLLNFAGGIAGGDDSTGALGVLDSLFVCASVVAELLAALVSAAPGVIDATVFALRAGCATTSWPTWRSNRNAPPMTTATIAPNAIPKCLTRFSLRDV
ncbi:MAG TPA: hypothetical protein VFE23_01640 [Usitatibacter sp.]|jgi:hypothetical protein|nr:hypothetical protein [Usitatibacter sp.]